MSAPDPMDRDVKVMFTDNSTRDYIMTASNIKEAEEVFDLIFNHMEQSITDLLKQYSVGKKTKVWVEYHIDKDQDMMEEEND
jgi:DNA-binding protein Fis|tara:strand:+ start:1244 stop:1489 length:246 start_codon:yes stop_codon:yes gene_type:complete